MAYTLKKSNGDPLFTVDEGAVNDTLSLKMIGKNYAGYGEIQNQNFVYLLENFASNNSPKNATIGQLWYDTLNRKLKFKDAQGWRTTGGSEVAPHTNPPTNPTTGDFWWDTTNKQLSCWDEDQNEFVLVGPQGVAGAGVTQLKSREIKDTYNDPHYIIQAIINDQTVFVISSDAMYEIPESGSNSIAGFKYIQQGITLRNTYDNTAEGVTATNHRFWGTSTDSDKLGGDAASDFVKKLGATFSNQASFAHAGLQVGELLRVYNATSTTPTILNQSGDSIEFVTTSSGTKKPLVLKGANILPGYDNTSDLGSVDAKFKKIWVNEIDGIITKAEKLKVGTSWYSGSIDTAGAGSAFTVACRDEFGNLNATSFQGTATAAYYADLAEKYLADAEYDVGTVLMVGGEKEVTAGQVGFRALGAVSEKPAFKMNSELEGGTYVALKGRVPVKVTGPVIKGQRLVAGPGGTAQSAMGNTADVFAIALESNNEEGVRLVECVIL